MLAHRYHETRANFDDRLLHKPLGMELVGKVLAIVGFGASGQELARRAKSFGMRIHAVDVRPIEPDVLAELQPDFLGTPADVDDMLRSCDFLSVHLHLTPETRHFIDARRIAMMKPTACVINVARGALIDEDALHAALAAGRLAGAGLDVFAHEPPDPDLPIYRWPNVVVTPHMASATWETRRAMAELALGNLQAHFSGRPLLTPVP